MIKIGETLPQATLKSLKETGIDNINLQEYLKGKKVVLFAVPAPFSSLCGNQLTSYIELEESVKKKGVDEIICVAVNDPFVLKAWEISSKAEGKITLLADWNAAFSKAIGLTFYDEDYGMGLRSQRYSSVVEDGVLTHIELENNPLECRISRADEILKHL